MPLAEARPGVQTADAQRAPRDDERIAAPEILRWSEAGEIRLSENGMLWRPRGARISFKLDWAAANALFMRYGKPVVEDRDPTAERRGGQPQDILDTNAET
jgi:hypothetical protein